VFYLSKIAKKDPKKQALTAKHIGFIVLKHIFLKNKKQGVMR